MTFLPEGWAFLGRLLTEVAVGVLVALLIRRFVCVLAFVKGRSMMDTLRNGEVFLALRRGVSGKLKRFDVVLCRYPGRRELFVKRVVALPGERVSLEEGALQIDGAPVEERFSLRSGRRTMEERVLAPGTYFVLGDNRPCSRDSRSVGPIADDQILAVARWVLFPFRRMRRIR